MECPAALAQERKRESACLPIRVVVGVSGARGSNPSFKLGKLALNRSTSPASVQ